MSRPTRAVIDLNALRHNFQLAQSLAPSSQTMPMVKANAYGHGAVEVAKALADSAPAFGVACIEEALELRAAGIKQPILLLEGIFEKSELTLAARHNFWLMVENHPQKQAIIDADLPHPLTLWLGLDSGMHRLGFQPVDIAEVYQALQNSRNVSDKIVVASHFACADDLASDRTAQQVAVFEKTLLDAGLDSSLKSLANSAAVLGWPQTRRDWQRPGYMLYGASPFSEPQPNADQLKPVMCFESAIISLRTVPAGDSVGYTASWTAERDSVIATVSVGYGDGYPRHAPNGTPVLINGMPCPLAGRVSMDMITVDVTDLTTPSIGDKVVLWGADLPVNEVADHCGTIGYELLTRMPARVPRIYL
jgi:alanine racemase